MSDFRESSMGAYEAKSHFAEVLGRVEAGEEITITRHGAPVAKLVPIKKQSSPAEYRTAIEAIRRLSKKNSLRGLKLRDLIAEGRR